MSVNNYALEIDSIILCKFGALQQGIPLTPDKSSSLDITPQVLEINIFESVFSPIIKVELAVSDHIGLFINFPLSGEEAIFIKYRTIKDNFYKTLQLIIDTVDNVNASDQGREVAYIIKCASIEAYANAKQQVQRGYENMTVPDIAKAVFDEYITARMREVFPAYRSPNFITENNDNLSGTVVIPNRSPFSAMAMLGEMVVSQNERRYSYIFYQTTNSFNFVTIQSLFDYNTRGSAQRNDAIRNKYIYNAMDPDSRVSSPFYNEGRVVTNLIINKRHSSLQKLATGYFHNNLFEINLAQKAVWGQPTKVDDVVTIYENKLNTSAYIQQSYIDGDDEQSNRTKYVLTAQRENDVNFPVSRYRDRWGKDLIANIAMSQIDLTITIPGTSRFSAGDLFYLELPEMHGFNEVEEDDLISGLFVVSEVKQVISVGGFHSTVLRINKDSYKTPIDRASRYV